MSHKIDAREIMRISAMPHYRPGEHHPITTRMRAHAERCMEYLLNALAQAAVEAAKPVPANEVSRTEPSQHAVGKADAPTP